MKLKKNRRFPRPEASKPLKTPQNHLKPLRTAQNPSKPLRTPQNPSNKTLQNPSRPLKTLQHPSQPFRTPHNPSKPLKTPQDPSKTFRRKLPQPLTPAPRPQPPASQPQPPGRPKFKMWFQTEKPAENVSAKTFRRKYSAKRFAENFLAPKPLTISINQVVVPGEKGGPSNCRSLMRPPTPRESGHLVWQQRWHRILQQPAQ